MLRILVFALAALAATGTLLSLIPSYRWYIRMWDFPRVALMLIALIALALAIPVLSGWARTLLVAVMLMVIGWQGFRIYPYTPLAKTEVAKAVINKEGTVRISVCGRA